MPARSAGDRLLRFVIGAVVCGGLALLAMAALIWFYNEQIVRPSGSSDPESEFVGYAWAWWISVPVGLFFGWVSSLPDQPRRSITPGGAKYLGGGTGNPHPYGSTEWYHHENEKKKYLEG